MRYAAILALAAALVLPLPGGAAHAQGLGNLTVTPTRLVFEGRTRSGVITLVNNGSGAATYRISIVEMRMKQDGSFERVAEDADQSAVKSAKRLFRYAPRQIELEAGRTQSIRILLRKPPELPEGEYRSHLFIQAIPKEGAGTSIESMAGNGNLSINLTIIPGVTLPVIVRHGALSATATLSGFSLLPAGSGQANPGLAFTVNRGGSRSVYGDLTATYFPTSSSNGIVVSQIKLLAVYVPNATRNIVMSLTPPDGVKLSGGKIAVSFTTPPSEGAAEIARGEFAVPLR